MIQTHTDDNLVPLRDMVKAGQIDRRQAYRLARKGLLTLFRRRGYRLTYLDRRELEALGRFEPVRFEASAIATAG